MLKVKVRNDSIKLALKYTTWTFWEGVQSLYCQGLLTVAPISKPTKKKKPRCLGVSWGGDPECWETCVLWPLAWAVPTGQVQGQGMLLFITPPVQGVALSRVCGKEVPAASSPLGLDGRWQPGLGEEFGAQLEAQLVIITFLSGFLAMPDPSHLAFHSFTFILTNFVYVDH